MSKNQWELPPEPKAQETPEERELLFCPDNHENPCAWRHACPACERICAWEKIHDPIFKEKNEAA